jgi:hypothetical protein
MERRLMTQQQTEPTAEDYTRMIDDIAAGGAQQITDLTGMSPADINTAREAGRLAVLLGADPSDVALTFRLQQGGSVNASELPRARQLGLNQEIVRAHQAGRITDDTTEGN